MQQISRTISPSPWGHGRQTWRRLGFPIDKLGLCAISVVGIVCSEICSRVCVIMRDVRYASLASLHPLRRFNATPRPLPLPLLCSSLYLMVCAIYIVLCCVWRNCDEVACISLSLPPPCINHFCTRSHHTPMIPILVFSLTFTKLHAPSRPCRLL